MAWLREAGPYIEHFRGKTFVVLLSDVARSELTTGRLVEDLVLLNSLGVRLILVQSTRHAINAHRSAGGVGSTFHQGRRITDSGLLSDIKHLVNEAAHRLQAAFVRARHRNQSQVQLVSGHFVYAKPLGIFDGVDHQLTGAIRRVDTAAINEQLDLGHITWIDHLAYAPSGQLYNLASEEIAAAVAIAMHADKLILLGEQDCLFDQQGARISELTLSDIASVQEHQPSDIKLRLTAAERAVRGGVPRCHLLGATTDGAILTELLTTEGSGTLVTQEPTARIRAARTDDLASLLHLLAPLESSGALVQRSREKLEAEIAHFQVVEQDGRLLGSAALYPLDAHSAELACLAVEPEQGGETLGTRLLHAMETRARAEGIETLFVLTTQAQDWFTERGFSESSVDALPENRQALYNFQRNSAVLIKKI